jgi:probable addiction module antidote protein
MKEYRDFVRETMRDAEEAAEYLKVSLDEYDNDENFEAFFIALRTVIEAQGGMTKIAQQAELNRQHLYRALSKDGNPRLKTLQTILNSLGLKISIEPRNQEKNSPKTNPVLMNTVTTGMTS